MEIIRNKKHAPTPPGVLLREVVLPELGITQGEFADRLGGISPHCVRDIARTPFSDA